MSVTLMLWNFRVAVTAAFALIRQFFIHFYTQMLYGGAFENQYLFIGLGFFVVSSVITLIFKMIKG